MTQAAQREPNYVRLHRSGELRRRIERALADQARCELCPRRCEADRLAGRRGLCRVGRHARVASSFPHHGEEACLRGRGGSGTIFMAGCPLLCVFCQNYDVSQRHGSGVEVSAERLGAMMVALQEHGCHNINLVTPSHVVAQILEALPHAIEAGLRLPIVYNSGGLDSPAALELLDGIVDIYMPDLKCMDPDRAERYLQCRDYPRAACEAVRLMHGQVGDLMIGPDGLARRGLIVRHLVLPGAADDGARVMQFLAGVSPDTFVNIMAQYRPAHKVSTVRFSELNRRPTAAELAKVYHAARQAGLHRFDRPICH